MSLHVAKEQIERFLNSDLPEVMAIKGTCGVGKTYIWNKLLKEANENKQIKYEKSAGVRLLIFANMRPFGTVCLMSPRGTAPFRAIALNEIQDFTIRARVLNFRREMAGNKRFSGESGREPRRIFSRKTPR